MEIRRAYKYRPYLSREQAETLEQVLDCCRELFNAALQEHRDPYRRAGKTISYHEQKRELPGVKGVRPEYRQIGSQVLQDVIAEEALAGRQRWLQTKKPESKNRRRAKVLMARGHPRIGNKRLDVHHLDARPIVARHGAIAIEGLRIKNLLRTPHLAKSIADAGWNQVVTILTIKAEQAGLGVVVVNPAGTSQVCSGCGRGVTKTLSDRWHTGPYEDCERSLQRDHNSAREILNRAGLADPLCGYPVAVAPAAESHRL